MSMGNENIEEILEEVCKALGNIDEAKQMLNSLLGTTGIALGIVSGPVLGIGKIILGGA